VIVVVVSVDGLCEDFLYPKRHARGS
jgi:hypothetical protein